MSNRRGGAHSSLRELSNVRLREFLREPEAVFWTFAFPVLLAIGLGLTLFSSGRIPEAALALRSSALVAPAMYIRNVLVVERNLGRVSRRKLT